MYTAHPRWRGEHRFTERTVFAPCGSSPLARGAQRPLDSRTWCVRLIPAGAGSTESRTNLPANDTAHPRWRGEHAVHFPPLVPRFGSSPLARGAHHVRQQRPPNMRLIPAGAGSTGGQPDDHLRHSAHPRWRGEHAAWGEGDWLLFGSSPLARGALTRHANRALGKRLIPAGAGSTPGTHSAGFCWSAHPRWRGEH